MVPSLLAFASTPLLFNKCPLPASPPGFCAPFFRQVETLSRSKGTFSWISPAFPLLPPSVRPHPAGAASYSSHRHSARARAFIIPIRPASPSTQTCSRRWGWFRARSCASCSCFCPTAAGAPACWTHMRHPCADHMRPQEYRYRPVPGNRMGLPPGGGHLLPRVRLLQRAEDQNGRKRPRRRPTPHCWQNGLAKVIIGFPT